MPEIDVYPRLERLTDDERARYIEFFRGKAGPEFEFRGNPPRFHFYDFGEDNAIMKVQNLRDWFCRETGIDPERITQGTTPPEDYRPKA
jgi:hypothetical protein